MLKYAFFVMLGFVFFISSCAEYKQLEINNAGKNRMRPIVMSTLIAILALMPIAINLGHGSDMLKPLAIAIIFRFIGATFYGIICFTNYLV